MSKYKIAIAGIGYVGMSIGALLSQHNSVCLFDIDTKKVNSVKKGISPIDDKEINEFLKKKKLNIDATTCRNEAYTNSDFIFISLPTNFDETKNSFDTSVIKKEIAQILKYNTKAVIVIKSTIPIGYTNYLSEHFNYKNILFSPEFLREGQALKDNLYPSRIIVGDDSKQAKKIAKLLKEASYVDPKSIDTIFTSSTEAESIKLFSNTYLALRVAFFNELDSFCLNNNLNSKNVVRGVSLDKRIGNHYNNPSFGYGGYCLPKDTRQLSSSLSNSPKKLISSIHDSNEERKEFISKFIIKKNPKFVGAYRMIMKANSDNFRESSIIDIIEKLKAKNIEVKIYEPSIKVGDFIGCQVENNLEKFAESSDLIITNRMDKELNPYHEKVICRDIFGIN